MNHFKKIELLANIAIITVAILLGAVLVKRYVLTDDGNNAAIEQVAAGSKVSLPGVDWAKNGQTLLLVLSEGCRYCTQSAGFYQRLMRESASGGNARLVAVLPQETEVARKYLNGLGVAIDDVRQASPLSVGTKGTPTLILVNSSGVVTDAWMGQLTPDEESKVLARLQPSAVSSR